ncbi:MAG TPA: hypothetical protein VLM05_00190, partial [Mycobacteriales bacterium]|nr:hypothetical protein [Mycobacteriales bacterium]
MTATDVAPEIDAPAPPAPARRLPWGRIGGATLPPLVALLAGWAMLAYRSGATGAQLVNPSTWARWDSGQYLRISRIGFFASYDCTSRQLPPKPPQGVVLLCGNAGWFPGYPGGVRQLSDLTHLSIPVMSLIVAWTCWFLVLVVMWQLLADARSVPTRWLCLLVAAFFPGQVYFAALFPISLAVAGLLACLYF